MRILITGARGQLGQALCTTFAHHTVLPIDRQTLDLSSRSASAHLISYRPDLVIHAAAYTNVDGCARDPDAALLANGLATKHVALACQALDVPLVYISTNEVFDGAARQPYLEFDQPRPINPYGYSKWAGEQVVQQLLCRFYIVRIAWVFGGPRNFVRTILRLAQERHELAVVNDEIGNPTYALDLARALNDLIEQPAYGVYHLVNEGYCSRYEFAQAIVQAAGLDQIAIKPITLAEYQRDSTPPPFGALRNYVGATDLGITLRPWQDALAAYLDQILAESRP